MGAPTLSAASTTKRIHDGSFLGHEAWDGRKLMPASVETTTPSAVAAQIQGLPSVPLTAAIAMTWPSMRPFFVQVAPASAE